MPFIRRPPKPSSTRLPDVYVSRSKRSAKLRCLRFFFMDELWSETTSEQADKSFKAHVLGWNHGVRELLNDIHTATGASRVNPHRQYIALHWNDVKLPTSATEHAVIQLLAKHFGWEDPIVGEFGYSSPEKLEIERARGIRWSPSS